MSDHWKNFWAHQTTPQHRRDEPEFYAEHSAELRLLFEKYKPRTVLDLCCGNGALYQHLGFNKVQYTGVDFSDSMLAQFTASYPDANLEQADVTEYVSNQRFDLILMEFAAGYFPASTLTRVFQHARAMMHSDSLFVCSSIPWRAVRWDFYAGRLTPPHVTSKYALVKAQTKALLRVRDPIGHWHNPTEIRRCGLQADLDAEFFGCYSYIYRFHTTLRVSASRNA